MTRTFIITPIFDKLWNNLNLTDDDLSELQNYILNNPSKGDIIQGTGGAVKLRWSLPDNSKGKSGGIRVIYIDIVHISQIHLLLCYSKNKQEDLTNEQKKRLKAIITEIKGIL